MKIFCTVGSQLPFDRLTRTVAEFAEGHGCVTSFFQIGQHADYIPKGQNYQCVLEPRQFNEQVQECDLIVSHAGMGTILTGLTNGRPVLVLPRRECYHETRNDHQVFTASKLEQMGLVHSAMDEQQLLDSLQNAASLTAARKISKSASTELIQAVQTFIDNSKTTP